jgi:branched-chain amino acid transport system permease protein
MDTGLSILVGGVVLGSLYAMMATGLSLVWSTLGIFNFAHGAFIALGAFIAWQVGTVEGFGLGPTLGLVAAVVFLAGVGCLVEISLVRPLLGRSNVLLLAAITTLGATALIENGLLLTWGARLKQLPPLIEGTVFLGSVSISAQELVIVVVAPTVLVLLWLFLKFSRTGASIRAVSQNPEAARLMGFNVPLLYSIAFSLSAALAGLAGVLLGSIRFVVPGMGADPLVKALIVCIFGGLGSLVATIGGAYVIGLIEAASNSFIGLYWTPVLLFFIMIVVLIWRPTGLFGSDSR